MKKLPHKLTQIITGSVLAISMLACTTTTNTVTSPKAQMNQDCNRACLNGFVDQYLAAMIAHDPSTLPVTSDIKFTENTVRLNLGEALWQTMTGLGDFKIYLADTYSNQAGFMGVIMENGQPKLLTLRLQIKDGKIKEVETIITRSGLGGPFPKDMDKRVAKPLWSEALKPSESIPRLDMVVAANLYFEGMEQNNGSIVPFADDCDRTENGLQTTNNPNLMPPMVTGEDAPVDNGMGDINPNFGLMGCKEQFDGGGVGIFQTPIRDFWMVDHERGLVLGNFVFTIVGGTVAIPIAELFKIKNGLIHEIEAIGISDALPHGAGTGW